MLKKSLTYFFYVLISNYVNAAPYIPNNPDHVLEKLPDTINSSSKTFNRLRSELTKNPNNVTLATKLAQLYIEQSRKEGDPRYLGYAQAALTPWWKQANPPIEVLVLRATLLQSTHQFDQSLTDLDAALKLDSTNGQVWLTRATILQVQGKYPEALKNCEQLKTLAPVIITLTCISNVHNLSGKASKSYQILKTAYEQNTDNNSAIQVWICTLLAEMANRLGNESAAESFYQRALQIESPDSYLLGAYADFLLDQKRPQEVINLLKTKTRVDPLLLRYAEALNMAHLGKAPAYIQVLKETFATATLRGDTVHQREQSRFELRLMHNPKRALELAKKNWQIQKEPADARIYLEAAIAMKDKGAIATITDWIAFTQLQDANLNRLIANIKTAS